MDESHASIPSNRPRAYTRRQESTCATGYGEPYALGLAIVWSVETGGRQGMVM
jgi:hypothetical protein